MINGIIVKGIGGFYYVKTDDGRIATCRARGKFRKLNITPMVGDKVEIKVVNENPFEGAIENVLERKNHLIRPPVANIDCIAVVIAAANPAPDLFLIDKLTVYAAKNNIEVVIIINKTDLSNAKYIVDIYNKCGYNTVLTCATSGEGVDALREKIAGKITAFAGNSGVGKSSILTNFGLSVETGDVSKINRGKHTTRHVELFDIGDGGFVIDTPGFSLLEISDISASELKDCFVEFKEFEGDCKFSGCNHFGTKANACGIVKAVNDGNIPKTRYESYTKLYDVLKEIKDYD